MARVYTPGFLSRPLWLQKGTQQGCPLSSLLFNLVVEPFSRYLENFPNIQGITLGNRELKVALFADNIVFFLAHPLRDVPTILEQLHSFRLCSGLKINASKSELLVLSRDPDHPTDLFSDLPVTIAAKAIKYLGITIGKRPESINDLNYPTLIHKIKKILRDGPTYPYLFSPSP